VAISVGRPEISKEGAAPEAAPSQNVFSKYAWRLLKDMRMRPFGKFAANLGFPMVPWLYANRQSSGSPATQFDFAAAIAATTVGKSRSQHRSHVCLPVCSSCIALSSR
jgi:hypothetical protein